MDLSGLQLICGDVMSTITIRTTPHITEAAIKLMNKIAERTGGVVVISKGYVRVITNRRLK